MVNAAELVLQIIECTPEQLDVFARHIELFGSSEAQQAVEQMKIIKVGLKN